MQDVKARLEKIRVDAEDCQLISKLATNPAKRLAFEALAEQYQKMARRSRGAHRVRRYPV
jgi:hypothetical protein